MQLSTRLTANEGEEVNIEDSPFFMTLGRQPGYAPMPQIAFQIVMRYMQMIGVDGPYPNEPGWDPLEDQVSTSDPVFGVILNVFRAVRDQASEEDITNGTASFSLSPAQYTNAINSIKDYPCHIE